MSQFQTIGASSQINFQYVIENILVGFYDVLGSVILKSHMNSYCRNVNLSDDTWVMLLIHFEVLLRHSILFLQVANMVHFFLRSHKLLAIFYLVFFLLVA